ncbi:MAG: hypothetical protein ACOYJL_09900 [Tractidigestivibacter sp.]|jgi:hypothetical protein|uniref:hypothetical protein n=1 Tax=Tractidigestivibacter sp. TaxID=2847320 RepID=UPI003D902C9A
MSKKQSSKAKAAEEARQEKSDRKYGTPLFSLTYEMNELEFSRAATLVYSDRIKDALTAVSIVSIVLMIMSIIQNPDDLFLAMIFVVLSVVATAVSSSWPSITANRARNTSLGLVGENNRRHVVVTADKVVEEGPDDRVEEIPISDLSAFRWNDDFCVAAFSKKRFIYVPRSAMSEGRYRNLLRYFQEKLESK